MHRDLVEQKKWIAEDDYKEGLALSKLAPGPLAATHNSDCSIDRVIGKI
jgi:chromate transport protein ChrA